MTKSVKRFFEGLLCEHRGGPYKIAKDKLRSYNVVHSRCFHDTPQYFDIRAELQHKTAREGAQNMRV